MSKQSIEDLASVGDTSPAVKFTVPHSGGTPFGIESSSLRTPKGRCLRPQRKRCIAC
ncbi:MAG: hypothetical protein ACJAU6_002033 [Alphaproteobacteria bacterium]|jgi:hypothetical protein